VTEVGLIEEKTEGRKSRDTVPLSSSNAIRIGSGGGGVTDQSESQSHWTWHSGTEIVASYIFDGVMYHLNLCPL
jgi:hypothetical protein